MPNCPLRCQAFNRESIRRVDQTNYCTICFDNVFYCKLLPCGHIYCSVCIDEMLHNERQREQQQRRDLEYQRNQLFRCEYDIRFEFASSIVASPRCFAAFLGHRKPISFCRNVQCREQN